MLLNATTPDSPTISSDVADDPLISLKVPAIMFATGVFGNSLAIFVLLRAPKEHRTSAFYRLVGALTATDLFGTCVTSPITLIVYANNRQWVGGTPVCNFHSFMLSFAGMSTVLMIGVMAIERFISVIMPYFYENHITKERAQWFQLRFSPTFLLLSHLYWEDVCNQLDANALESFKWWSFCLELLLSSQLAGVLF
ncbi:prostaglandin E2 receptor EP4 subtype-like [Mya arenaria]|uniref:prostaglandin E2 receptor EP4 subtype-like n=1 Tax=Mya arenaria TaxID=6604 RepID=UPI0022E847B1|nr:prostaglandin E2 receptor EP4 subtype-like [Mya arenaria]